MVTALGGTFGNGTSPFVSVFVGVGALVVVSVDAIVEVDGVVDGDGDGDVANGSGLGATGAGSAPPHATSPKTNATLTTFMLAPLRTVRSVSRAPMHAR
jgi:hypothetical protein